MVIELIVFSHNKAIIHAIAIAKFWRATKMTNIYWSLDKGFMHGGDAQFNCSTSKVVKFGQLPDHDILIDYGLIVNRLVVVDFFFGGGGGGGGGGIVHL